MPDIDLRNIKDPVFKFILRDGTEREVDPFYVQEKMQEPATGAQMFDAIRSAFGLLTTKEYEEAKKALEAPQSAGDEPRPTPYLATRNEAMELWYGVQAFIAGLESTKKHLALMQKSLASLAPSQANG
jgi:hypothetical protein